MVHFEVRMESLIDEYIANLDAAVDRGLQAGTDALVKLAQGRVRRDTDSLSSTIDAERLTAENGIHEWSVNAGDESGGYKGGSQMNSKPAGSPVDYALDQEYGGGESPYTPYMTPASEDGWPIVQAAVASEIEGIST